jgi:tRNA nucleotidyltransferase (CCA-adding enzyme)
MPDSHVQHADVKSFAENKVNLKQEDAEEYRGQVRRLREKLGKFIDEHPDVGLVKMLLSGSLAKSTALKTLNDIDVAIYVDAGKAPQAESDLLDWLAEKLRKAYPQMAPSQISPGNHCVRISFSGSGLDVDVVPVYYEGDENDKGYLYSRDTGERVLTSIPMHVGFVKTRADRFPTHYRQLIRLAKWWSRYQKQGNDGFRCKSFLTEMLMAHVVDTEAGVTPSDYPSALEKYFAYIVKSQLKSQISFTDYYKKSAVPSRGSAPIEIIDPVNVDNNVARDYSEQDRRTLVDAAEEALDRISEARFATTKGRAEECWQDVLGPTFQV